MFGRFLSFSWKSANTGTENTTAQNTRSNESLEQLPMECQKKTAVKWAPRADSRAVLPSAGRCWNPLVKSGVWKSMAVIQIRAFRIAPFSPKKFTEIIF